MRSMRRRPFNGSPWDDAQVRPCFAWALRRRPRRLRPSVVDKRGSAASISTGCSRRTPSGAARSFGSGARRSRASHPQATRGTRGNNQTAERHVKRQHEATIRQLQKRIDEVQGAGKERVGRAKHWRRTFTLHGPSGEGAVTPSLARADDDSVKQASGSHSLFERARCHSCYEIVKLILHADG